MWPPLPKSGRFFSSNFQPCKASDKNVYSSCSQGRVDFLFWGNKKIQQPNKQVHLQLRVKCWKSCPKTPRRKKVTKCFSKTLYNGGQNKFIKPSPGRGEKHIHKFITYLNIQPTNRSTHPVALFLRLQTHRFLPWSPCPQHQTWLKPNEVGRWEVAGMVGKG